MTIDTVSFLVQNLSPIALDRKLETDTERNHVKLIWDKCTPTDFTSFILREKNFFILSETQITYQKANEIVKEFIGENAQHLELLKQSLINNTELIRYVCAMHFPKIYSRCSTFGIKHKSYFDFTYHLWRNEKLLRPPPKLIVVEKNKVAATAAASSGKDPASYEKRDEVNEFEQKPIIEEKYKPMVKKTAPSKPKTTKKMMEKKLQRKREKRAEKKLLLEKQLAQNTEKTEYLESIRKKQKMSL